MENCYCGAAFEGDAPAAASETALLDRRELALVAVERTRMPMVITDPRKPDNPIVLANQAFLDLTGYEASEVVGYNCRFLQGPDTDPQAIEALRRELRTDEKGCFKTELLNYRKDGSSFWNELAISAVHDEHGELIYYFASQRDVTTERRTADLEQAERQLLREVDHRAMNVLALVQSIVSLTRADTTEHFSTQVGARVDALARAHRFLSNSGWAQADIGDIIGLEIPSDLRARVTVSGPSTPLPAQQVQPLVLMFHEMMANARQHGALASSNGALSIGWTVEPETLIVNWCEHGGNEPVQSPPRGLGLSLVDGIITRQLGGKAKLVWHESGLCAELQFPFEAAHTERLGAGKMQFGLPARKG